MLNQQLATQQLLNTGFSINKTLLDYEIKKQEYESSGYDPLAAGPKKPSPTDRMALIGFHSQIEKLSILKISLN